MRPDAMPAHNRRRRLHEARLALGCCKREGVHHPRRARSRNGIVREHGGHGRIGAG